MSKKTTPELAWKGVMQVCLAAEKCGNLDFDVRNDMWYSSEGLFCNTSLHKTITFWDILRKVCILPAEACSSSRQPQSRWVAAFGLNLLTHPALWQLPYTAS